MKKEYGIEYLRKKILLSLIPVGASLWIAFLSLLVVVILHKNLGSGLTIFLIIYSCIGIIVALCAIHKNIFYVEEYELEEKQRSRDEVFNDLKFENYDNIFLSELKRFNDDVDIMKLVIAKYVDGYSVIASDKIKANEEIAYFALTTTYNGKLKNWNPINIESLPNELKCNREFVTKLLKFYNEKFTEKVTKTDKDFLGDYADYRKYMNSSNRPIDVTYEREHIAYNIRKVFNNLQIETETAVEFFMDAVKNGDKLGINIDSAPDSLKNNKENMLSVIKTNPKAVEFLSESLGSDKNFMLEVLKLADAESVCKVASKELMGDYEFGKEALAKGGSVILTYLSKALNSDKKFMTEALEVVEAKDVCKAASKDLLGDYDFAKAVLKKGNLSLLTDISDELRGNKEFMLDIAKNTKGTVCEYATKELQDDRDFILEVIKYNIGNISYASRKLKNNRYFMKEILKCEKTYSDHSVPCADVYFANDECDEDDENNAAGECDEDNSFACIEECSDGLRADKDFMLDAIEINANNFSYASEELKYDRDIVKKTIISGGSELIFFTGYEIEFQPRFDGYKQKERCVSEWTFDEEMLKLSVETGSTTGVEALLEVVDTMGLINLDWLISGLYYLSRSIECSNSVNDYYELISNEYNIKWYQNILLQLISINSECINYLSCELNKNQHFWDLALKANPAIQEKYSEKWES